VWDAGGSSTSSPPPSTSPRAPHAAARFLPGQPDGPPVYPPPPPGARPRSQELPPQAVLYGIAAHVFGVDVAPHPQGVAVVEPGLTAALGTPHQQIAAPVAHQGIGEVGSSSARGRSMKKPSRSIFCRGPRGESAYSAGAEKPKPAGPTPVPRVPGYRPLPGRRKW